MRIYSQGNRDAEPSWVGQCQLCKRRFVSNLDPLKERKLPDECGYSCAGPVLLHPEWEALLAAFLVGGYDAISSSRHTIVTGLTFV